MKTIKIFSTAALALVMAACSSDDIAQNNSPAQQEGQRQAGPGYEATLPAHSMPTHSRHRAQRAATAAREMPVFTNPCRCRSRTRRAGTR